MYNFFFFFSPLSEYFYRDPEIWRSACLRVWGRNCTKLVPFKSWREMFLQRPRVRFDGNNHKSWCKHFKRFRDIPAINMQYTVRRVVQQGFWSTGYLTVCQLVKRDTIGLLSGFCTQK